MYAMQINTNEYQRQPRFLKAVYGDTVDEVAEQIEEEAADVARWLRTSGREFVTGYLAQHPNETVFCGEGPQRRYDLQLADGKGAPE